MRGRTLPELFILAAIVVPNQFAAMQRAKQKKTMAACATSRASGRPVTLKLSG
ncbi:MAG: hypothetical protein NDJ92_18860 [Thermoanaerobaculia bacterium]|nr:hypothetical protein [Thermoanaerobaculia bacterium]